jgi:hypothetical protein
MPTPKQQYALHALKYATITVAVMGATVAVAGVLKLADSGTLAGRLVPQDYYASTGGSVWVQSDWRGGSGQSSWSSVDRYNVDDGNIDNTNGSNGLLLKKTSGNYSSSGWLESSTFDTGGSSDFTTISWQPQSQVLGSTIQFQLAANNDNATWNYVGPDGTASTYYTIAGTSISSALDGKRYIRYKAYLSTTDSKQTPNLSSVSINYVSGCYTPGQVVFVSLTSGNNYDLDLTLNGYQTITLNNLTINGNAVLQVLMNH